MANPKRITIAIGGMTCGHCVMAVKKELAAVPGVTDLTVTLDPPRAVLTLDTEKSDVPRLLAAVTEAGYSAGPTS